MNSSPICWCIHMHWSPKSHVQNDKPILILFHPLPIASKQPQLVFLPSESDMRGKCIVDPSSDFGKLLWPCSAYERKQPGTYQVEKVVSFEVDRGDPFLPFIYMHREFLADQVSALQQKCSFFFFFLLPLDYGKCQRWLPVLLRDALKANWSQVEDPGKVHREWKWNSDLKVKGASQWPQGVRRVAGQAP